MNLPLIPISVVLLFGLAGCTAPPMRGVAVPDQISTEIQRAAVDNQRPPTPDAVFKALLPPLKLNTPASPLAIPEPRFDLAVTHAPAREVFSALVQGTRYSMLAHPDIAGSLSLTLKNVSVPEALEAIRELYGYDYRIDGSRILVQPLTLQSRVFKVNYLTGQRKGSSDTRVSSGSISDIGSTTTGTTGATTGATTRESSRVSTTTSSDFWSELSAAIKTLVSTEGGRTVIVNPQSGIVLVRAMPGELRQVAEFLKASQLSIERQVILEAKIIEVTLSDAHRSGINWAAFSTGSNSRSSLGMINPGATLQPTGSLSGSSTSTIPLAALAGSSLTSNAATGALFGMAFQANNFAALLSFLESQGTVHVLSSPRIATLNNQKAILKVGSDEFFVTNYSSTTTAGTTTGTTQTTPSVTLQPFFSGIVLDVTPQIDEHNTITLHIHPSVSQVSQDTKTIELGGALGTLRLPSAKSSISETDSIIRAQDGQIVVLGGLMSQRLDDDRSGLPGAADLPMLGAAFRQTSKAMSKRELVILLKPTVVQNASDWTMDVLGSQRRIEALIGPGDPHPRTK